MANSYRRLRPALVAHDSGAAIKYLTQVEHSLYGERNALLYLMDLAMVQFDGSDASSCIATLERAKALCEHLYKAHAGDEIAAWLSNDNALPYLGEDFERVFLHLLEALSYARLGQLEDARVEARQVTSKLSALAKRLVGQPITYKDDAFAHFLSGLLYEADNNDLSHDSDARIEYARALELYDTVDGPHYGTFAPKELVFSMARVLRRLGNDGLTELTALKSRHPNATKEPLAASDAFSTLHVLLLVGEAPTKVEDAWEVLWGPNIYRVAYPRFVPHRKTAPPFMALNGSSFTRAPELVMDLQAIAVRNLADHMSRIKRRVMSREVAKYAAGTVAEGIGLDRGGLVGLGTFLAGLAVNTVTSATAHADIRSWATLPEAIYLATARVAPGPITLQVGARLTETVHLGPQETRFVVRRVLLD